VKVRGSVLLLSVFSLMSLVLAPPAAHASLNEGAFQADSAASSGHPSRYHDRAWLSTCSLCPRKCSLPTPVILGSIKSTVLRAEIYSLSHSSCGQLCWYFNEKKGRPAGREIGFSARSQ